jgi:hypothetical protein
MLSCDSDIYRSIYHHFSDHLSASRFRLFFWFAYGWFGIHLPRQMSSTVFLRFYFQAFPWDYMIISIAGSRLLVTASVGVFYKVLQHSMIPLSVELMSF